MPPEPAAGPKVERRRYPPPELDFGVIHAAKIAGILVVPMAVVASMFAVYLQGFRADIRLDMSRVVEEGIERHMRAEATTFAAASELATLRETARRMQTDIDELKREEQVLREEEADHDKMIARLLQKNGLH